VPLLIPNNIANGLLADGDKLDQNFETIQDWGNQEAITRDGATAMTAPLLLPGPPTAPNQAATKAYVDQGVPVSTVVMFAGATEPTKWLFCRGQTLSRATYAELFAVIGTSYGAGDGATTFNLPNYQATMPVGYNSNVNSPAGLAGKFGAGPGERYGSSDAVVPSHSHTGQNHAHGFNATGSATTNWGEVWQNGGGVPVDNIDNFAVRIGDGITINMHKFQSASFPGSVSVSGVTVGVDRDITTGTTGVTATNANYPPSLAINFIIKVQ
jgi:microcystin-dependent protein